MQIVVKGKTYVLVQSHIDPSVWSIVRGSVASEGAGSANGRGASKGAGAPGSASKGAGRPLREALSPEIADSAAFGYLVTYVGDFLIASDDPFIDAARDLLANI